MYAKINWRAETIEFISDEAAKRLEKPTRYYELEFAWFDLEESPLYSSPEEAMDDLINNHTRLVAESMADADDWDDPHCDPEESFDDAVTRISQHPDWMREYLRKYQDEWCSEFIDEDTCFELVKVPT